MLTLIPVIHGAKHLLGLTDGEDRALGEHAEIAVGHDGRDLDDAIALGHQPGHFQIDPDEAVGVQRMPAVVEPDSSKG